MTSSIIKSALIFFISLFFYGTASAEYEPEVESPIVPIPLQFIESESGTGCNPGYSTNITSCPEDKCLLEQGVGEDGKKCRTCVTKLGDNCPTNELLSGEECPDGWKLECASNECHVAVLQNGCKQCIVPTHCDVNGQNAPYKGGVCEDGIDDVTASPQGGGACSESGLMPSIVTATGAVSQ